MTAALLLVAGVAYLPPGQVVARRAARAARRRVGIEAVWEAETPDGPAGRVVLRVGKGGAATLDAEAPPPAAGLLRRMLAGDVAGAVAAIGADAAATSLALHDDLPAVVIGVAHRREPGPQVWVDAARRVPLRCVAGDLDIRFHGTDELLATAGLPVRIEVRRGGAPIWRARLVARPTRTQ